MAARERQQVRGIRAVAGEAGDGAGDVRLDLAGGLADALALDPAELLDVGPGLSDRAGVAHPGVLGRIGERPEDAPLNAPVLSFGRGVHRDGEAGAALLPRSLLPDRQTRRHGGIRREREQRGKKRRECRPPARADCP